MNNGIRTVKNKRAVYLLSAAVLAALLFAALSRGAGGTSEAFGYQDYYEAVGGAAVTNNADGGVRVKTSVNAEVVFQETVRYGEAQDVNKPLLLYIDPKVAPTRYFTVEIHGTAARASLLYTLNLGRQSASEINVRNIVSGFWNNKPSGGGMDEYRLEIAGDGLRSYINGEFIEFWAGARRNQFPEGKIYLRFGAGAQYWETAAGDAEADLRVGNPTAVTTSRGFSTQQAAPLEYALDLRGARVSDVYFMAGSYSEVLDKGRYTVTNGLLSVEKAYVAELARDTAGAYELRLINTAREIRLALYVSTVAEMAFGDAIAFDIYAGGQTLTAALYANLDAFVSVSGRGITGADYSYSAAAETLTFSGAFLRTLPYGGNPFLLHTSLAPGGIPFAVTVYDTAPPSAVGGPFAFDGHAPADVQIQIQKHQNELLSVTGHGLAAGDYGYDPDGAVLTLRKEFLSTLVPNATYTFTFEGTHGAAEIAVGIIDSEPAVLAGPAAVSVNLSGPIDARFSFDLKYDFFTSLTGNAVTESDYTLSADGLLTVKREYIAARLAATGDYWFTFATRYNPSGVALKITVFNAAPPALTEGGGSAAFEKQQPSELRFAVARNGAAFVGVFRDGGIPLDAPGDYMYSEDGGTSMFVLSPAYLSALSDGAYTFRFVFANGEIDCVVTVSNSARAAFPGGYDTVYLTAPAGEDFTFTVEPNGSVFSGVSGNGITAADYAYNDATGALTFKKEFLAGLPFALGGYFTVRFDNVSLRAWVTPPLAPDPVALYTVDGAEAVADGDAVRVTYKAANGWAVLLGGLKIKYRFDVTRPIQMSVDFLQISTKPGYQYVFTLSPDGYKMHWGDAPAALFGAFGAGPSYLMSAYFGQPGIHDATSTQIQHELLARRKTWEVFTFDIGADATRIYFNGRLLRTTAAVTRDNFPDGYAYALFSPLTYTEAADRTDTLIYRFKANGQIEGRTDFAAFNSLAKNGVSIKAFSDNSVVSGVYLVKGGAELPLNGYAVDYDYPNAGVEIRFSGDAVAFNPLLNEPGDYTLRVRGGASYFDAVLRVSDSAGAEIVSRGEIVFDLSEGADLALDLMENLDTFTGLSGNGIAEGDYGYNPAGGKLTVRKEFLNAFPIGAAVFLLESESAPEGVPFTVYVIDASPPEIIGSAAARYDLSEPAAVSFRLDVKRGVFAGVEGAPEGGCAFDAAGGTLVFTEGFLSGLRFGAHSFRLKIGYGAGRYNELSVTVDVYNSVGPAFSDGGADLSLFYARAERKDVSFSFTANRGTLLGLEGAGITPDLYRADAAAGEITLFREWAELLGDGVHTVFVVFDNGTVTVRLTVSDTLPAESPAAPKGCGTAAAALGAAGGVLGGAALIAACRPAVRRRGKRGGKNAAPAV
ncbi:MAG: hypothetical protein LBL66_08585 [Clostridiales bacterium]|jgi:hypothetical protein|nr:hypothetical protein [Clostridiales bacterium]